jgi:hypothetical protein
MPHTFDRGSVSAGRGAPEDGTILPLWVQTQVGAQRAPTMPPDCAQAEAYATQAPIGKVCGIAQECVRHKT